MSTVLLVRHGLTAVTGTRLIGRLPGVELDERGRAQAEQLAERLAGLPLAAVVTSPLERCTGTVAPLLAARPHLSAVVDDRLVECGYGEWQGRALDELAQDPLWPVVQQHPSAVTFPGGESLAGMAARAVAAVRDHDARLGDEAVWLACSHADVIKAVVADALGLHLDQFQRLVVDPASVTVVRYTPTRPFVLRLNDVAGQLGGLLPPAGGAASDAVVGGGSGAAGAASAGS